MRTLRGLSPMYRDYISWSLKKIGIDNHFASLRRGRKRKGARGRKKG